jgi:hypothetical protein
MYWKLGRAHSWFGIYREEKNLLSLPEIKPWLLELSTNKLLNILT